MPRRAYGSGRLGQRPAQRRASRCGSRRSVTSCDTLRCAGSVHSTGASGSGVSRSRSASSSSTSYAQPSRCVGRRQLAGGRAGAEPPARRGPGRRRAPGPARRGPSGSAGQLARGTSRPVGFTAPSDRRIGPDVDRAGAVATRSRISTRNGDGPRGRFVPSPHQNPLASSSRRGRVTATYASRRSSRSSCAPQAASNDSMAPQDAALVGGPGQVQLAAGRHGRHAARTAVRRAR